MRANTGNQGIAPLILNLRSSQLHALTALFPLNRRLGGQQSWSWNFGEKIFLAPVTSQTLDHPACSLVTVWTILFQIIVPSYRNFLRIINPQFIFYIHLIYLKKCKIQHPLYLLKLFSPLWYRKVGAP